MNVLILGLGQYENGSGIAAALYYAQRGDSVFVTDPKPARELGKNPARLSKYKNVRLKLGRPQETKDLEGIDLVVRNPRVPANAPVLKKARKEGIPVVGDISVFLDICPCDVIGVTGTRGKSTTTTMLAEILRASKKWRRVWLGGNILISPLTFVEQVKRGDLVVLELSSWQTEILGEHGISPHIALWTNFMRDHLNVHASLEDYAEAKAQIFRHQGPRDLVFLPVGRFFDGYAREAAGRAYRFGKDSSEEAALVDSIEMKALGAHNRENAMAAVAVARALSVSKAVVRSVLKKFKGIPNRQEILGKKHGIVIVNDTTATTPDATIAAIKRFKESSENIFLIFGGADKELEFHEVAKCIRRNHVRVALLPGTAHASIVKEFRKMKVHYVDVKNLREAVTTLLKEAEKGDALILSPGCASFGLFKNEFDRGEKFKKSVKRLR